MGAICYAVLARRKRLLSAKPQLPQAATALLDAFSGNAFILDTALTVVYANPAAEAASLTETDLLFADTVFMQQLREVLRTGVGFTQLPDAENHQNSLKIEAVRINQRFLAVLVSDLGAEQRLNAVRRDFVANVSHELKTPLAALSLLAEALLAGADDPQLAKNFATSIAQETTRLKDLTNRIIHLSMAESQLPAAERAPLVLAELVQEQVRAHSNFAQQKNVTLVFAKPGKKTASQLVWGRKTGLEMAIANVLANAIRFSPSGGKVGIGLTKKKQQLLLTVSDTGCGIPEHLQERIFERFFRVDSDRNRASGGTGLGLAITRHTLRSHGGDVSVWSKPGVGTTFTLAFPIYHEPEKKGKKQ